jgi:hypothetical protein
VTPDDVLLRAYAVAKLALAEEPPVGGNTHQYQMSLLEAYLLKTGDDLDLAANTFTVYKQVVESGSMLGKKVAQTQAFDQLAIAAAACLLALAHFPGLEDMEPPSERAEYLL